LIDRGPESLRCLDLAMTAAKHMRVTALMGNHEQILLICLKYRLLRRDASDWQLWLRNAGSTVMAELSLLFR
jgi:hypothetical protein